MMDPSWLKSRLPEVHGVKRSQWDTHGRPSPNGIGRGKGAGYLGYGDGWASYGAYIRVKLKMAFEKTVSQYSKTLMPILMGLCIGIALSLILVPLLEEQCLQPKPSHNQRPDVIPAETMQPSTKTKSFPNNNQLDVDYWSSDIFEPRRRSFEVKTYNAKDAPKIMRPRYASTELGIREKLFIGVLSSRSSLDTNAIAVNKTLSHLVPKLVFFLNSRGPTLPSGMSMVIFSDEKAHLMPFHMFKYVADHYVSTYDWFYFMMDSTYVRGDKLYDLVEHVSIGHDLMMGRPVSGGGDSFKYCDANAGILISQSVMTQMVEHLDYCIRSASADQTDSINIGHCIQYSIPISCTDTYQHWHYLSHGSDAFNFNRDIPGLQRNPSFNQSLTVHKVSSDMDFYRLHRYFCEEEMRVVREKLEVTKSEIAEVAPKTPAGNKSLTWPIGVEAPNVPRTRFDVIRWTYFSETHLYLESDFYNGKPLKGVDKEDVQDIIKVSMERLNNKYKNHYSFKSLINGYRRFDATRGMDYIMDLLLFDRESHTEVKKRVYLMRPLGYVEIVPMPYVTENSRVNLILPVMPQDRDSLMRFLESYAHTCLESGDNTHLFVVFIYTEKAPGGDDDKQNDIYSVHKSMITFNEAKYKNGAKIAWTAINNNNPTQYTILDVVSRKFPSDSLFLYCSVAMELSIDFMNRVRMNTISQWQVFFPIGFQQYKPNLIHDEKPYPTTIDIKRGVGHYDHYSYAHASFYNTDYLYARKQMISTSASHDIDLYDLFLKYHNLHVFRAVEPSLKVHFQLRDCPPSLPEDTYSRCVSSRSEGLASRSQLAMLIFEYQQKLDQMQLNVMHQQNGQNVEQMKPDMLR